MVAVVRVGIEDEATLVDLVRVDAVFGGNAEVSLV